VFCEFPRIVSPKAYRVSDRTAGERDNSKAIEIN
jgi:hypothetical protein